MRISKRDKETDEKPMRVGRLERVKPTFLLIDTLKYSSLATQVSFELKYMGGERALALSRKEGGVPWRDENSREDRLHYVG
jgi:hypothetical protein